MSGEALERGYWRAYRNFYRWGSIARGATAHHDVLSGIRHAAYAVGWKKLEPLWDVVIRARRATSMLPVLEAILSEFGRRSPVDSVRGAPGRSGEAPDRVTSVQTWPGNQIVVGDVQPLHLHSSS
jgi:hypothetical protein